MEITKHIGVNEHRLTLKNPIEVAFALKWRDQNDLGRTLEWIMSGKKNEPRRLSDRDYEVAATVIQWLGSSVGLSFLRDVAHSCPEMKEWCKFV